MRPETALLTRTGIAGHVRIADTLTGPVGDVRQAGPGAAEPS
jgi:hypothetical protein